VDPARTRDRPRDRGSRRAASRVAGYAAAWLVAAAVAVTVGLVAVTSVGASLRDRGPIGVDAARFVQEVDRVEGSARPDPADPVVTRDIEGEFGVFVVSCQGPYATGDELRPAPGWRLAGLEDGPDDDVEAVVATEDQTVSVEVFCDQGRPAVVDREVTRLPTAPSSPTDAP